MYTLLEYWWVFQPATRINSFEKITKLSIFEDSIDNVVGIINDNGGFTIIGWYKRWYIKDQIKSSYLPFKNRLELDPRLPMGTKNNAVIFQGLYLAWDDCTPPPSFPHVPPGKLCYPRGGEFRHKTSNETNDNNKKTKTSIKKKGGMRAFVPPPETIYFGRFARDGHWRMLPTTTKLSDPVTCISRLMIRKLLRHIQ